MTKVLLALSLVPIAGLAHADLRSEIEAARHKQERAATAKDYKGAETAAKEGVTTDFKYVQDGKVQDAKTYIKNFMLSMVMMEKVSSSSSHIISLSQSGNNGAGKVELHMTGTMKYPDKTIHLMNWTGIFTEEYRKVGGKWKTAKMTAGPQKFLVDGKPAKM